jgi:aminopeptidase N
VTCDDFRAAMVDANGRDLTQFERWYSQAGTPRVKVETHFEAKEKTYTLTLTQSCPATPGQDDKLPFHIPVAVGLLDAKGCDLPLHLHMAPTAAADTTSATSASDAPTTVVLELTQAQQTFRFDHVKEEPVPSLLRDFSAPGIPDRP